MEKFEEAKALLSHRCGTGSFAEVLEVVLAEFVERHSPEARLKRREARKAGVATRRRPARRDRATDAKPQSGSDATGPNHSRRRECKNNNLRQQKTGACGKRLDQARPSRHIPSEVRDEVFVRDRGACMFVARGRSLRDTAPFESSTHTGDLDGALGAARKGIEVDPHNTSAYLALLQTLLSAGRTAEAQETFRDLLEVQEANRNPSDAFVVLMAEAALERARGNPDKALEALRRADAMPIGIRNPWTQWWIEGGVMVSRGDRRGAINAYRKIVEPAPFLVDYNVGVASFRIPFYYELARLKEEAGQFAEARQHYNAYLERWGTADVSIPNVDDARKRLAKLDTQM